MFLTPKDVAALRLAQCGSDVFIDDKATIYGGERIRIGNRVRIDAGSIFSAGTGDIELGSFVHIGAGVQVYGSGGVVIRNFVSISPRATLLSVTDDFRGPFLTGPLVPEETRNVEAETVNCEEFSVVGCGAVVLPGVTIGRGAAVGALSLVKEDVPPGAVVVGTPARQIDVRDLSELEIRAERARRSV